MARTILPLLASQFIVFFILSSFVTEATRVDHGLVKRLDPKLYGLGKEKLSHFRLYWHDVVSGNNPTAVPVVPPVNLTAGTGFGTITIIDDPLTEGPEISSKMVGRAQGLYAMASREEIVALMSMNFAFPGGKYNGSTITVVGRNSVNSKVREMPVIGGSGMFRFARGYVEARTHTFDKNTGDAIVEYTCYVLHH